MYWFHFLKWVTKNIDIFYDIFFFLDVPVYVFVCVCVCVRNEAALSRDWTQVSGGLRVWN